MQSYVLAGENTQQRPLISVCCICKRQRTSIDTWTLLDISEYDGEVDFSHGFCPDCIREHYPHVSYILDK